MNSVLQSKVALPLPSLGTCMHTQMHTHTHNVGVDRSYLASQHESVAEAGYRSSGLSFSLFAVAQQRPAGFDHTCSIHSPQTRSHRVSVYLQHYWLLHHDHDKKEGAWQPVTPLSRQAWHKPSSPNFMLLIFLLPASPAGTAVGSIPQPLGLPCGSPGSPAARSTCGASQSSIVTWKRRGHGCLLTPNPTQELNQLARHVFILFIEDS